MASELKKFGDSVAGKQDALADYTDKISPSGDFKRISGINVIVNSLRNLLLTPLGTYPFDPTYGSELYKKVFELNHSNIKEEVLYEVRDRVRQTDDRIYIQSVDIQYHTNLKGFRLSVTIEYDGNVADLDLDFDQNDFFGLE